jgi:type IV pilus assembly protein PilN
VILINLLPHREARRQQRKQAFFAGIGFAAIVGAAIVLVWFTGVKTQIDNQ